ncbi:amino acid adenylation domain-containing protein [Streptomyces sp. NPDC001549]|uniref:hybrid non-ribosomal peptide synthetase/type I polyketide synthase n=1 Tax=Streptomyces sp. NPDC001549 TaxID=3364586 RepID=UPI00369856DB
MSDAGHGFDDDMQAIAVTGLACRFPGADSAEEFWNILRDGVDPREVVPRDELQRAGRLERSENGSHIAVRKRFADPSLFDADYFGMTPAEATVTDPQQRFLLETAVHALEDAGLDPAAPPGRIGVYLGVNISDYLLENLLPHPEVVEPLGFHRVLMGNDRGYTATQVAYRLGLTGPALAVDCACSSSLAAVHHACRALLDYEADAVLAGGAAINPNDIGYSYTEGGISSPDACCRPFSADARGTVFSNGVGLVVLRRLEDALEDGDRILAVIRASAINNDGAHKSGYTAPSPQRQAELIAEVHQLAGVTADRVSYVEAHGTGTPLGDPIEVSALTQAFRQTSDGVGYCAIGSVKSNIGHLDAASGIAGLIKTVLALQHRTLPPSLGCERPNPHIDFDTSPFRVNTTLRPWAGPEPLLAGVSSFGVGGTNVHLLVEEAPTPPAAPRQDEIHAVAQALPFSAKSAASLTLLQDQLLARVRTCGAGEARDVAAALASRRSLHPLRRALLWRGDDEPVVLDVQAVDAALYDRNPAFVLTQGHLPAETIDSLLAQQPAFRDAVERLSGQPHARARETAPAALAVLADLGIAAVWAEHGIRPGAVVADEGHRIAAAVLCGVVAAADVPGVLRRLADGAEAPRALADVTLHPAEIPWYTTDGSEVCAAGRVPGPAVVAGTKAPAPGRRTLPPRVPAVIDVLPIPNRPDLSDALALFPEAVTVTPPKEAGVGHEALSACLGLAWVAGLVRDRARLARVAGPGRFVELPRYPFDRRRYWVQAGRSGMTVRPSEHEPQGDVAAAALERTALEIFAEALGTTGVSLDDDLFSLGGDSFLATRVVALARARWKCAVPLGSFMEAPTPGGLARIAADSISGEDDQQPLSQTAEADDGDVPATSLQEGFLFLGEIQGAAEAFNVPVLADLRGRLDVDAMREAVRDLVARHETLRTAFRRSAGRPVQVVVPEVSVELPLVDVKDETALRAAVAGLLDSTIATDRAPLFVAQLLRTGPERHVLVFVLHHLVADATSTGILLSDLYAFYNRRTGGEEPFLPEIHGLAVAHAKAEARWLKSAEADRQLSFWRQEMASLPAPLELPGDRPRRPQRGYQGAKSVFTLPSATADRVRELAAAESTTPFVVVLSTFAVLLSRICDQQDLVIGCPISGRHRIETHDLIGNFVNTLPIRFRIADDQTFRSLLRDTARRVARAMDHQDLPFEVLARELERTHKDERNDSAVFRVLFNMLAPGSMAPAPPAGLQLRPLPFDRATSPYELSLDWWTDDQGAIGGRLVHDTERFTRATVAGWQESFGFLLDQLCQTPDTAVDTCAVAPAGAVERTTAALAGPVVDVPDLPVHAVFAEQAARHPHHVAVSDGHDTLTYGELARLSGGLADLLASQGVSAGARVGLAMPRGVRLAVALLGVLRAGGTAVAYDLSHPRQRLSAIAEHCRPVLTLCNDERDAVFVRELGQPLMLLPDLSDLPVRDGAAVGDGVDPECGAYVTYTSGTTGKPKGIHFPHRALTNLIHWETERHTVARRWLQFASFGFDAAFHEMFAALCAGGSLHVVDEETKHDHDALAQFVLSHRVEKAIVPVSLMQALAARFEQDPAAFSSLREIAVTGEQLRLSEAMLGFFERLPDCRLINNYGPAETHVVTSFVFPVPPREWPRYAPIGKPLQNVTLDIVGARARRTVPWGSVGELVISGPCVATGYLGDQTLTDERFVRLPGGRRAYRSGDRTQLLHSGDIAFLGRADQQVKIRGVRVEIGEIEVVMREDPGLADVALVVRGTEGDQHIAAYLVPAPGSGDVVGRIRGRLREALPAALVPSTFTLVEQLPVNANGKVDPARLPAPGAQPPVARAAGEPSEHDEILTGVLDAFRRILEAPGLDAQDDFLDAGGHSLLATRLIHAVREAFGVRLSITDFYQCGTAERVARLVSSRQVLGASYPDEEVPAADAEIPLPPGLVALADRPGADRQKTAVYDTGQQLDAARLTAAVAAVLECQPALRTRVVGASDTALAAADAPDAATVTRYALPPQVTPADAAAWLYEQGQQTAIDPRSEPLVRVSTLDLPDSRTLLAVTVHLLALDGRGLDHLCRALGEAYSMPTGARAPDDGFLRYLTWRNRLPGKQRASSAAELWQRLLAPLPARQETTAVGVVEQHRAEWQPDPALQQAVRTRCAQQRTTPFTLHLTAFALALSWSRGTRSACPAVPLDGRFHQRFEKTVGAFANVVPVPLLLPAEQTLGQVLEGARQVVDQVLAVSGVPYADLAATRPGLVGFLDLPEVFNYARDDDEPVLLGTKPLLDVGPDLMAPGRRLHLTVVDNPQAFRVVFRHGGGPGEARLLALYRQALYALAFEPGEYVGALDPTGVPA